MTVKNIKTRFQISETFKNPAKVTNGQKEEEKKEQENLLPPKKVIKNFLKNLPQVL